ncbi:MAG: FadR/GntR family transcriptional regulator [Actinomycetota bacterium]
MTVAPTIFKQNGNNISEDVILRLNEMMKRGEILPGGRLPPERDLAKTLGVSRPTLRSGIRSLTAIGILRSRQGAGTFVVEASESPSFDSDQFRLLAAVHGFTSDEMFEARLYLEMYIAALAAERATSEQMTRLAEEIAGMFASPDEPEQFLIHDMKFHQTIAAASNNRILTALMNMVTQILFEGRCKTVNRATDLKESAEMHHQIYLAIRKRNPEAAGKTMRDHLIETQKAQQLEMSKDAAEFINGNKTNGTK